MPSHRSRNPITRREALCRIGNGFGMMAFAGLVGDSVARAAALDHPARAKHVIFLFMNGGLSQVDSFDPKPALDKYHGQPLPGGTAATQRTITATITAIDPKMPSITFSGPNNWKYTSKVQDTAALAKVKVGDKVDIVWTEAVLVSLDRGM